jgi:hypothetical protein
MLCVISGRRMGRRAKKAAESEDDHRAQCSDDGGDNDRVHLVVYKRTAIAYCVLRIACAAYEIRNM